MESYKRQYECPYCHSLVKVDLFKDVKPNNFMLSTSPEKENFNIYSFTDVEHECKKCKSKFLIEGFLVEHPLKVIEKDETFLKKKPE